MIRDSKAEVYGEEDDQNPERRIVIFLCFRSGRVSFAEFFLEFFAEANAFFIFLEDSVDLESSVSLLDLIELGFCFASSFCVVRWGTGAEEKN